MSLNGEAKLRRLRSEQYVSVLGVGKDTFDNMYEVIALAYAEADKRNRNVTAVDSLLIFLSYWYENRTMERIGFDYGISKQAIHKIVKWVERILRSTSDIDLPAKRNCDLEWNTTEIITDKGEYVIKTYKA